MNKIIRIGVVQTSLDYMAAWIAAAQWQESIRMSLYEEKRAKKELRHYLASLNALEHKPDIVLLPELSVPLGYESKLIKVAEAMESIIIAGLDYKIDSTSPPTVSNEAIVIVPRKIRGKKTARRTEIRRIGKTYPAPAEAEKLKKIDTPDKTGVNFRKRPTVWLFESPDFGKFAVAVCYDFMDLDRVVLYRGRIQTLFILAYNKDITSFDHIAEAISRTVFCNVVICNCGYYGGSVAVSPYKEAHKRTVYRHSGAKLTNAQVVELPLLDLYEHQTQTGAASDAFKSLPPGYDEAVHLIIKPVTV